MAGNGLKTLAKLNKILTLMNTIASVADNPFNLLNIAGQIPMAADALTDLKDLCPSLQGQLDQTLKGLAVMSACADIGVSASAMVESVTGTNPSAMSAFSGLMNAGDVLNGVNNLGQVLDLPQFETEMSGMSQSLGIAEMSTDLVAQTLAVTQTSFSGSDPANIYSMMTNIQSLGMTATDFAATVSGNSNINFNSISSDIYEKIGVNPVQLAGDLGGIYSGIATGSLDVTVTALADLTASQFSDLTSGILNKNSLLARFKLSENLVKNIGNSVAYLGLIMTVYGNASSLAEKLGATED